MFLTCLIQTNRSKEVIFLSLVIFNAPLSLSSWTTHVRREEWNVPLPTKVTWAPLFLAYLSRLQLGRESFDQESKFPDGRP